jgi:hypothetical protein
LSFHGKLQGVAEDPNVHSQTIALGRWQAVVSYGMPPFGRNAAPISNPEPSGGALIGQLGPDEFLVTGLHARVSFQLTSPSNGLQVQYARVEQGTYEDGNWKFLRVWNGDQTDWGLNFMSDPAVLHVHLATY